MSLIYSFVARDNNVLSEYTAYSGNFNTIAIECLQNVKNPENKFTITCDRHTFNFLVAGGFTYLIVADESSGRALPFAYLERIKDLFEAKYGDKGRTAAAHSLDRSFGAEMKKLMEQCMNSPEDFLKIANVQKKVDEVKNIMVENIEKVLERGEKIELLVDKAEDLNEQAAKFQKYGKQLRSKMWWESFKMKLIVMGVVLVAALIIFLVVCFGAVKCFKKN